MTNVTTFTPPIAKYKVTVPSASFYREERIDPEWGLTARPNVRPAISNYYPFDEHRPLDRIDYEVFVDLYVATKAQATYLVLLFDGATIQEIS